MEGMMDTREIIKGKLSECFDRKIVRTDLTKKFKEGVNVLVFFLEFLLGQYCSFDDEEVIEKGVENVKRILADNYLWNIKHDAYETEFPNRGLKAVPITNDYLEKYDRLFCSDIWCIV